MAVDEEVLKLKSKEPKQPKEKKSGSRSRKSSEHKATVAPEPIAISSAAVETKANGAAHLPTPEPLGAEPAHELIRQRAYELFVRRGYKHGHHLEDWLTAERELKGGTRS